MTRVSVVIPAHNEAGALPALLDSLAEHLDLEHEVIVVDNGSTDETSRVVSDYGCRLIQLAKVYPATARNAGAAAAIGEVLAFLDADVTITPSWARRLASMVESGFMHERPCVTGDTCHVSKRPSWIERYWFEPLRRRKKQYMNGANTLVLREDFDRIGGFDERLETGEDVDFCRRAAAHGLDIVFSPEFKVHHEGFPRTLRRFFARERWHGRGDLLDRQHFARSRVAQIAAMFLVLYVLMATALLLYALGWERLPLPGIMVASWLTIVGVCLASSFRVFKRESLGQRLLGAAIYFVYFNGRMCSMFDRLGSIGRRSARAADR